MSGTIEEPADVEQAFERIQDHRDLLRDIEQMQENLAELEKLVREAEWVALDGRGCIRHDRADKLCEAIEGSMPYLAAAFHDLDPERTSGGETDGV